ncbi:hypothetical protein SAMN04487905_105219 [Actinopolyspora xinjiangensis]|uniref:WXG100 family type VII secretion target n=1 Tax=Actinopolyspora xinjiangensis TaxID=405564 RepID=A0A1H0TQB8_9ACTN|nr:hypothetical protein [Actinopolyspora xinjiangensis]SDP56214.1 hypothetical protein SAMN04487905_105219 [Actinopolyspora xinjiangensis]
MPIDTRIEGDPESIRSAARWLRSDLAAAVHDCASRNHRVRTRSERVWRGDAGEAFRGTLGRIAPGVDELAGDIDGVGRSFERYADDLHTAQQGMRRARDIAVGAGLRVTDTKIFDPGSPPAAPRELPDDATPRQTRAYDAIVSAQQAHARKAAAYAEAEQEANKSRSLLLSAKRYAEKYWNDLWNKRYIHATDFTNGVVGGLVARNTSIMRAEANRLDAEARTAESRYLRSPGGSAESKFQTQQQMAKASQAEDTRVRAGRFARRVGGKLPVVGLGITAVGIGYDIHTGKPPGKAVFSGLAGAGAAALVASTPVGWGALAAVGVGIGVGVAADFVYDALPQNVRDKINEGVKAVGDAVSNAAGAVGDAVSDAWNAVF